MNKVEYLYKIKFEDGHKAKEFNREFCAYVTGLTEESDIGSEYVDEKITELFEGIVRYKPSMRDDEGDYPEYRPSNVDFDDNFTIEIYLKNQPTEKLNSIFIERMKEFFELLFQQSRQTYSVFVKEFSLIKRTIVVSDEEIIKL